jgi:hypothetical protein
LLHQQPYGGRRLMRKGAAAALLHSVDANINRWPGRVIRAYRFVAAPQTILQAMGE